MSKDETVIEKDELTTRLESLTKEQEQEILLLELGRLRKKEVINFELYIKARKMWEI